MDLRARLWAIDRWLVHFRPLWHPQPFRIARPAWCQENPELAEALLALPDDVLDAYLADPAVASQFLANYLPDLAEIDLLTDLPLRSHSVDLPAGSRWAWEIPGRKRAQIEAFARGIGSCSLPVLDWCGGKGHLGRLLGLVGDQPVLTIDLDPALCTSGRVLSARQRCHHEFRVADALTVEDCLMPHQQAVALHACGHLHRALIARGADAGVSHLAIAPCCYYRGVDDVYPRISEGLGIDLTLDDSRLAVTETVTASPRLQRKRDHQMAWKLGFDALRRDVTGNVDYQTFKSVPAGWFGGRFDDFARQMLARSGVMRPEVIDARDYERQGWVRQREVMRLSLVRFAFRRALEVWMVLDQCVFLETRGYEVQLGQFCDRQLTPRNLLISASLASGN